MLTLEICLSCVIKNKKKIIYFIKIVAFITVNQGIYYYLDVTPDVHVPNKVKLAAG